jgi:hypothetical protein
MGTADVQGPLTRGQDRRPRPLLLTALSLFSFVYFGFLSVLLLLSVFYSGWITGLLNTYNPGAPKSGVMVSMAFILVFLFHALCLTGTILIFRLKRTGYYIYGVSALVISCYQLFQPQIPVYSTAIPVALLVLFGIFFKRLS